MHGAKRGVFPLPWLPLLSASSRRDTRLSSLVVLYIATCNRIGRCSYSQPDNGEAKLFFFQSFIHAFFLFEWIPPFNNIRAKRPDNDIK